MATAYLLYGYDLGDPGRNEWSEMEAHRFGKDEIEECPKQFGWLLEEDGYGGHQMAYDDLPNVFAKRILRTWFTEEQIEDSSYAWSMLAEEKGLTVKKVGWAENDRLVLTAAGCTEADDDGLVAVANMRLDPNVEKNLRDAYATLDLHPGRPGADGPRWLLGLLH